MPCTLLIGHPWRQDGELYNAASVIRAGQLVGRYFKQCLPNYGVFDEKRYFSAGSEPLVFELNQQKFAVLICEDVWHGEPAAAAKAAGADWALVLNASPYELGKKAQREHLLTTLAKRLQLGFVYVNQMQGQDELVFDGSSLIVSPTGDIGLSAPAFKTGIYSAELRHQHSGWQVRHHHAVEVLPSD